MNTDSNAVTAPKAIAEVGAMSTWQLIYSGHASSTIYRYRHFQNNKNIASIYITFLFKIYRHPVLPYSLMFPSCHS